MLRRITIDQLPDRRGGALDAEALSIAREIIDDVLHRGEAALREHAHRLGDLPSIDAPLLFGGSALRDALNALDAEDRNVLERTAARIEQFARAQMAAVTEDALATAGGEAGWRVLPVHAAGCYAPGGRYPLPSSVLMTAVTARVAGVKHVVVASPKPAAVTLAAASIAGADALLAVGGAHGIAAMTAGIGDAPRCDVIVGPGNAFVTAAKFLLSDRTRIDMLAGPSELLIIADDSADPAIIAADLLAQAEHDADAIAMLIALDEPLLDAVDRELETQLATLPTAPTAQEALARNGFALQAQMPQQAATWSDLIAPEHLQLSLHDAAGFAEMLTSYGAVFIGEGSAEVFGDYGFGPNHVLPTGGTARFTAGLSVMNFLRFPTWLRINDAAAAAEDIADTIALARMEGLEAHARAAERRCIDPTP